MIIYKNTEYPTRTFLAKSKETGDVNIKIASFKLFDIISDDFEKDEAQEVDNQIYMYISEQEMLLSAKEIVETKLDIKFKLIKEY
jgi:hypothetical protein